MSRICFVSFEIFPTTRGGCGTLLHNAARVLLAAGHEVTFLLDLPTEYFNRFRDRDRLALPNSHLCRAYHVDALCAEMTLMRSDFLTDAQWRSLRFHTACERLAIRERPDVIEFFDYCGPSHYALAAKAAGLAYGDTQLVVRLHNSLELMDAHEPTKPLDLQRYGYYALEHSALRMAETVLHPSTSYLAKAYRTRYESWFGAQVLSQPPLVEAPPRVRSHSDPDVVLFYGRLFAFKGVDRFVDAAVALLNRRPRSRLRFVLVGHDSHEAPDESPSYQEYLRRKIPTMHQGRFEFTDHLDWNALGNLLPAVLFAVFPSYLEAFCYAAHELYAAGVPIIVSNIPNFDEYFRHEVNALVFDGTTSDLTRQMIRLCEDSELRQRISRCFPVAGAPVCGFYDGPFEPTWITRQPRRPQASLLVAILTNSGVDPRLAATLAALDRATIEDMQIAILEPSSDGSQTPVWLLGALRAARGRDGTPMEASRLRTTDALLVLCAGDQPDASYLSRCLETLARQPQLGFIGCWKEVQSAGGSTLETFPLDAALELVPFLDVSPFSRVVMRTQPGRLLVDLFDLRAGFFGELAYLWKLEAAGCFGLVIPAILLYQASERRTALGPNVLSYLIMQDSSPWRSARLSRYLVALLGTLTPAIGCDRGQHVGSLMTQNGSAPLRPEDPEWVATQLDGRTLLRLVLRKLAKKLAQRVVSGSATGKRVVRASQDTSASS
jgi:glycosyltransferase involved in cell wall biosynthesis